MVVTLVVLSTMEALFVHSPADEKLCFEKEQRLAIDWPVKVCNLCKRDRRMMTTMNIKSDCASLGLPYDPDWPDFMPMCVLCCQAWVKVFNNQLAAKQEREVVQ